MGLKHPSRGLHLSLAGSIHNRWSHSKAGKRPARAMLATEQEMISEEGLGAGVGAAREADEERRLRSSEGGAIAGIPRHEWVR